ncbi:uncharacterized protein LOC27208831 [Drosophila simulans]|nr:uncharacterized protein LOC27208831 [Drosophila simulans]
MQCIFTAIHQYYQYLTAKENMSFNINFNLFCVLLLVDFGQPEYAEYVDPEEPLDDHLTRPDEDVASSDNEMTVSYDYHNENHDSTNHPDPQVDVSTDNYSESYVDHYTTGMDYFEENQQDTDYGQHDPHIEHEIEDRIVRYAMHKWREEI